MKVYKNMTKSKQLRKSFNYYQRLKKRSFKLNLEILLHIDKTSYNSIFLNQSNLTEKIENIFETAKTDLKNKNFKS